MSIKKTYNIRVINSLDQDFLFEMLYQSIYVSPCNPPPDRDIINVPEIRKYVENWGKKGDYGLIATDLVTGNRLGAVWLRYFTKNNKGYGYISADIPELGISVDYGMRGYGIGTALLHEILLSTNKTVKSISLSVDPGNPAVKLYKRFGFTECGAAGTSIIMRYDNK